MSCPRLIQVWILKTRTSRYSYFSVGQGRVTETETSIALSPDITKKKKKKDKNMQSCFSDFGH